MNYELSNLTKQVSKINDNLPQCKLPVWDELPILDLYMDQVIILIKKYISVFSLTDADKISITPSMINNYVKLKIMPAPVKKKYSKTHIAYLIIICTLKQTMSMAEIQKIIPVGLQENEVKNTYNSYVLNQLKTFEYVRKELASVVKSAEEDAKTNPQSVSDLIMQIAIKTSLTKIINDKLLSLECTNDTKSQNQIGG